MRKRRGITAIELLVVISIATILIAIALPSVGKAREDSHVSLCGMHMRQICKANLMYAEQNNGALIPAGISGEHDRTKGRGGGASGGFWASDLAAEGYLPTNKDVYGTELNPTLETVFYCPDGSMQENPINTVTGSSAYSGSCPRSEVNTWCMKSQASTLYTNQAAVSTWYQLNAEMISAQSRVGEPGTMEGGASPFVNWNRNPGDAFKGNETLTVPGGFGRSMSLVHVPGKFVLLLEASGPNWDANGMTPSLQPNYPSGVTLSEVATVGHPFRLAGRHGNSLNNGYDGYTNMAYFDGHVAMEFDGAVFEVEEL